MNPPFFTGGGQKFRLRAAVGTRRQDYQLTFIEPWFLGRRIQFGVDLYHRELNFLSTVYDEQRTGGRVSLTKALWRDFLIGGVSYDDQDRKLDRGLWVPYPTTEVTHESDAHPARGRGTPRRPVRPATPAGWPPPCRCPTWPP